MDVVEQATEESVSAMITALDRYESFVTLFADSCAMESLVNDPLVHLLNRLPLLFGRTQELTVQDRIVTMLTKYILNPLNNRKVVQELFNGIIEVLSTMEPSSIRRIVRQMILTMLIDNTDCAGKPVVGFVQYAKPIMKYLTAEDLCNIQKIVLRQLIKPPPKKNGKMLSIRKTAEYQTFLMSLFDRGITSIPYVLVVNELSRSFVGKPWFEIDALRPLTAYFSDYERIQNIIQVRHRDFMFPVVGYSLVFGPMWSLDPSSLIFLHPPNQTFTTIAPPSQSELIRYILEQKHSRHMFQTMLGLVKGKRLLSSALEDQLTEIMVDRLGFDSNEETMFGNWLRIAAQLISVTTCGYINFAAMIEKLKAKLQNINNIDISVGRFYLIWTLYQCIALHADFPIKDFLCCSSLFSVLFPQSERLPVPDFSTKYSVIRLSPAYLWAHITRRALQEKLAVPTNMPQCIFNLCDYVYKTIEKCVLPNALSTLIHKLDHPAAVNCFVAMLPVKDVVSPTRMDYTVKMAESLIEPMKDSIATQSNPEVISQGICNVFKATKPLSMESLDVTSSHIKLILFRSIGPLFTAAIQNNRDVHGTIFFSPAFWETNARLLLYEELDSITFDYFCNNLPQRAIHTPGIIGSVFEMLSFRVPYIPASFKSVLMMMSLTALNQNSISHPQVLLQCEQLLMRVIHSFGIDDFPRMQDYLSQLHFSPDTEELTRLIILTCIRLSQIAGLDSANLRFLTSMITAVQQVMPHSWNPLVLSTFHPSIQALYPVSFPSREERKQQIKQVVEQWSQRFRSMSDAEFGNVLQSQHFNQYPIVYCLIWKQFYDQGDTGAPLKSPLVLARILDKMGYRTQLQGLRCLVDLLILELPNNPQDKRLKESLGWMIWKYGIIVFDRLLFILLMRNTESQQEQNLCLFIASLLLKSPEFAGKITETLEFLRPNYWDHESLFEKVTYYHDRNPEATYFTGAVGPGQKASVIHQRIPTYYSNVVLRCIPLLEIFVHRCLEGAYNSRSIQYIELVLETCGRCLRYHDRPVLFLWQTFLFFDKLLKENISLKRALIRFFIVHKAEFYPPNFYFSPTFTTYLIRQTTDGFSLPADYFEFLVSQMCRSMYSHNLDLPFEKFDWRFHEFPNATTHCLYTGALELMTVPCSQDYVVDELFQVIWRHVPSAGSKQEEFSENLRMFYKYLNCVSLFLSALPERYFISLLRHLENAIKNESLEAGLTTQWDFEQSLKSNDSHHAIILQLFHNTLLHNGTGHLLQFLEYIRTSLTSTITTEAQLIFTLNLCVPLLSKLHLDPTNLQNFAMELLLMLRNVITVSGELKQAILIADVLFHVKHTFPLDLTANGILQQIFAGLSQKNQVEMRFLMPEVR